MRSHLQYFFYESTFSSRIRETKRNDIENMVFDKVEEVLKDPRQFADYLPVSKKVTSELLQVLSDPNADLSYIETVISREPVVAVRLIAIANGNIYGKNQAVVSSIPAAVERLGTTGITNMIHHFGLPDPMSFNLDNYQIFGKPVWEHSLHVAFVCHDLAGKRGIGDPQLCYLLGLIHDIGKIVIFNILSDAYQQQSKEFLPCSNRFIELMTTQSALLSEKILEVWHFDKSIVAAVKRQVHTRKSGLANLLFIGNLLSESYLMIKNGCFEGQDGIDLLVKECGVPNRYVNAFFSVADTIASSCE